MMMCYFVRCAMLKAPVYRKKISDKKPEDRAAQLHRRFG